VKLLRLAIAMVFSVLASAGEVFFGGSRPHTREALTVVTYTAFTVGYSEQHKVPLWSAYSVIHTHDDPKEVSRKYFAFFVEKATQAKINMKDYTHSGYSRGHMTPFAAIAYAFGPEASRETFSMANIVPQIQQHNAGIWSELEKAVGGVRSATGFHPGLTQKVAHIWVYTGPVLGREGTGAAIPTKAIAIPTALWKAAIWFTQEGKVRACAWIIPHQAGLDRHSFMDYATTMRAVEHRTGVTLVPEDSYHVMERCDSREVAKAWP